MKAFAAPMMEYLNSQIEELAKEVLKITQTSGPTGPHVYTLDELRQLIAGFVALIEEALEGGSRDTFQMYVETVIPSLVRAGSDPAALMRRTVNFGTHVGMRLGRALPPEVLEEAVGWYSEFLGNYVSSIAAAANATARQLGR